ncbi:hypothetical protein [Actinomyces minihominis]|uniref:hypothetical protein n=1 Tax=Actinomyces minihominis TaxID=2002838 RepID=UPI000C077204|nr:hypothetical protein [Actinomyces minihominis]
MGTLSETNLQRTGLRRFSTVTATTLLTLSLVGLSTVAGATIPAPQSGVDPTGTNPVVEPQDEGSAPAVLDIQSGVVGEDAVVEGNGIPLALPVGRNYLVWEVTDTSGVHMGGSTVSVQGPRAGSGNWGTTYNVTDCVEDPCAAQMNAMYSMDQDPRPGYFAVKTLTAVSGTSQTNHSVSSASRYRILPVGSMPGYEWASSTTDWVEIPGGSSNSPTGWPSNGPWDFGALQVRVGLTDNVCLNPSYANSYYTLQRSASDSTLTTIYRGSHNAAGTSLNSTLNKVTNSTSNVLQGQTANALGVTPTGVFYFTGQNSNSKLVTVYRFDPAQDTSPYSVFTMNLLSPTAGYVVAGDSTIYQGREEFYFAYFSMSPGSDSNRPMRMHVYRYSPGVGSRTGEVSHVDVPRPKDFTSSANAMNGDFAFDAQNNIQFIISDSNGGLTASGVVAQKDFQHLPGVHNLTEVPTVSGSINAGKLPSGMRQPINGVTFTGSGSAIIQQSGSGAWNALADPTTLNFANRTSLGDYGNLVDLASCSTPATITIQKVVDGVRTGGSADQFALSAERIAGSAALPFEGVTTEGVAPGLQARQVGPYVLQLDGTLRASETFTNADTRADYATRHECHVLNRDGTPGEPFLSGEGESLEFALNIGGAGTPDEIVPGANVVCVFTNTPFAPARVVLHKDLLPEDGGVGPSVPAEGWGMTASARAATGKINSVAPAAATQPTDGDGNAEWTIRFERPGEGEERPTANVTVLEEDREGFSFVEGSCTHQKADGTTATYDLTGSEATGGLTVAGVGPGETLTCNYLNGSVPTLQLCKRVEQVEGGVVPGAQPTDWLLSANLDGEADAGFTDVALEGGDAVVACSQPRQVQPGDYALTEKVDPNGVDPVNANAYTQLGNWSCEHRKIGQNTFEDAVGLGDEGVVSVLGSGAQEQQDAAVRCTVTNQTAELTVLKQLDGHWGPLVSDFELSATPGVAGVELPSLVDASGNENATTQNSLPVLPNHRYAISEQSSYPYLQRAFQQYLPGGIGGADLETCPEVMSSRAFNTPSCWVEADPASVSVEQGERGTYRFVNMAPIPPRLPDAGGTAATWFLIGGLAVVGLAAVVGATHLRRRAA